MATPLRTLTGGLVLIILAVAPPVARCAAAEQVPAITPQIDLDGVWELEERGARSDDSGKALVRIKVTNKVVAAVFITGAECFDGTVRDYAFVGDLKLEPILNPPWLLSSKQMWVCSGTPSLKEECGGRIPSHYKTTFTNAKVAADKIEGERFAQGYKDCALDPASDGTATFTLTRAAACSVEAETVAAREREFRNVMASILDARGVFAVAIEEARQRYPETYRGRPTEDLRYPFTATNLVGLVEFEVFVTATPDLFQQPEWANARVMASEMGVGDDPPIPEVRRMFEEINRIEQVSTNARRAHRDMLDARAALDACRRRGGQ